MDSFLVNIWLASKSSDEVKQIVKEAKKLITETKIKHSFGFHQISDALAKFNESKTGGKLILKPSLTE